MKFGGVVKIFNSFIALILLFNIDSLYAQTSEQGIDLGNVISGMIWGVFFKFILPAGILLIIFSLFFVLVRKKAKGFIGEKSLSTALSLKLDRKTYSIFENLYVPAGEFATQIDLLVLSVYGMFVVEIKNYSGWIFGDEKSKNWTQVVSSKKNQFQNPIRQNYKHIKALAEYLNIETDKIFSVIYFAGDAEFKTDMPSNVLSSGLSKYINSKKTFKFQASEVNHIYDRLIELKKSKSINKSKHKVFLSNYQK